RKPATCWSSRMSWRRRWRRSAALTMAGMTTNAVLERQQHPRISEDVGLDVAQIEKLGHAGVVGTAHLVVDLSGDRGALDLDKAVPAKEFGLEGQHEHAL